MKYYSEQLKRLYDSEEDLKKAEAEALSRQAEENKKKEERKARYEEVQAAYKKADAERQKADELLRKFIKDYGGFHGTVTTVPTFVDHSRSVETLINWLMSEF